MKIKCQCGTGYEVKPELVGRKVTCKKCSQIFEVKNPNSFKNEADMQTTSAASPPAQKAPPSFSRQTNKADKSRQEREDELLAGFTNRPAKKSLDERIAERHQESIERDRTTNSIKYMVIGLLFIAAGVAAFFIFKALDDGGVAPVVVWVLKWIGGKYWIPPALGLVGMWQITIGFLSLFKVVDIDEEDQIPTKF